MRHILFGIFSVVLLLGTMAACGLLSPSEELETEAQSTDPTETSPVIPEPETRKPEEIASVSSGTEGSVPETEPPAEASTEPPTEPPMEPTTEPPADDELVDVRTYIPSLYVELRYAAEDNFVGTAIYDFTEPSLRYGTVKKLAEVQEELLELGYSLKIWDAFRPVSAQFRLWEICPDPNFVANPNKGHSNHSRGNTVDLTLVLSDGTEIPMPSEFDDFSPLADRDYSDVPEDAAENAMLLEQIMTAHGFRGYQMEWWHYADETSYPVIED